MKKKPIYQELERENDILHKRVKELENKLKRRTSESEKKFRELFEKSGDAILIIENEAFIDCN